MTYLRYSLLAMVLACLSITAGWSQDGDVETDRSSRGNSVLGTIYFDIGLPTSAFGDNMSETGYGFGGELLFNLQKGGPLWAGAGVHSFAFDDYSVRYFDFDAIEYEELTASRLFVASAIMRFQPEVEFVLQPYMQGGFGMHWYFTNTKVEDVEYDEVVDRFKENADSALGFALHGGVMIVPRRYPQFRGDIRFGYFRNASVEYMRYNPRLPSTNGYPIDYFEVKESPVEILGLHIGMTFAM